MPRKPTVAAVVEAQSAACRTLAICIRAEASSRGGLRHRSEAKVMRSWADTLDQIADAMAKALDEDERSGVSALWRWSIKAALPFVAGALITGAGEGGAARFIEDVTAEPDPIAGCAAEVVEHGRAHVDLIMGWAPVETTHSQRATRQDIETWMLATAEYEGGFNMKQVGLMFQHPGQVLDDIARGLVKRGELARHRSRYSLPPAATTPLPP